MDKPFIFNKPIIFPPDPIPVADPRPQQFALTYAPGVPAPPVPRPGVYQLTADDGTPITDDSGSIILIADENAPFVPPVAGPPGPQSGTPDNIVPLFPPPPPGQPQSVWGQFQWGEGEWSEP